ncbi:MAG: hypothetical protein LBL82_08315 [Oscillospiraceae bacterium]|jgi:hypothetical protein|nr:hypothetical protein [Oscillospiraceae bacterium]
MELYQCSTTIAHRYRDTALKAMAKEGKCPCGRFAVNTKMAFKAWSINIDDCERRLKKLKALGFDN